MTTTVAPHDIDPARFLEEHLSQASPDLLRQRAQVRVITLGLSQPAHQFPGDRGAVHPDIAGNLRLTGTQLMKFLDLDPVTKQQMSVMCGHGSATLQEVI